jgi:hypothetical protein
MQSGLKVRKVKKPDTMIEARSVPFLHMLPNRIELYTADSSIKKSEMVSSAEIILPQNCFMQPQRCSISR